MRFRCRGCGLVFIGPGAAYRWSEHTWECDWMWELLALEHGEGVATVMRMLGPSRSEEVSDALVDGGQQVAVAVGGDLDGGVPQAP